MALLGAKSLAKLFSKVITINLIVLKERREEFILASNKIKSF